MKRTTKNIVVKIGSIIFIGLFMMLAISAKIARDQLVANELTVSIDHTTGNFFITEADVMASVNELIPESGTMIHTKDLKDLELKLEEMPQVGSANVFVNNTGQLSIEVKQRQPMYRVIKPDGKSYYVDRGGYKFPVSKQYTARVPVATGFIADNGAASGMIGSEIGSHLFEVFDKITNDRFWSAQFGQVEVNDRGEVQLIPRMGNHKVLLGKKENLDDELKRLRIFYHEGISKAGWDTYKSINVKYKDQVVCTK